MLLVNFYILHFAFYILTLELNLFWLRFSNSSHKMSEAHSINYDPETSFEEFMSGLRQKQSLEWRWLVRHFRQVVVPWIRKKDGNLPLDSIVSVDDFVEEVFAKSMVRYYELFQEGTFHSLGDLRGLIFRIAEYKLKEGYHSVKRDKRIFFSDENGNEKLHDDASKNLEQRELVKALENEMNKLPAEDQELLLRYSNGERLKDIADDLGIDETSCRMRKYRAMKRLKGLMWGVFKT